MNILVIASRHQVFHEFFLMLKLLGHEFIEEIRVINAEDVNINTWSLSQLDLYDVIWIHNSRQNFQEIFFPFLVLCLDSGKNLINVYGTSSRLRNHDIWKGEGYPTPSIYSLKGKKDPKIPFAPPFIIRPEIGHQKNVLSNGVREEVFRVKVNSLKDAENYKRSDGEILVEQFIETSRDGGITYETWRVGFINETLFSFSRRQDTSWLVRSVRGASISPELSERTQTQLKRYIKAIGFQAGLFDFGIIPENDHVIPWEITPAIKFEFYEYMPFNFDAPSRSVQRDLFQSVFTELLHIPVNVTSDALNLSLYEVYKKSWR
jgi:hypothetical protein